MPMLGMTGRFHRSWADWGGLKHPDALRFECAGILATGGAVCIGDQLHPRGRLNSTVYDVIGEALEDVAAVEAFCVAAEPCAQIGLLTLQEPNESAEPGAGGGALEGAAKMLLELHHQFDVITVNHTDEAWARYELIVVADSGSPEFAAGNAARLRAYCEGGGKLLVTHEALVDEANGNFHLADILGVDRVGAAESAPDYFEILDASLETRALRRGFAYTLYEGPATRVQARPATAVLAAARESYFNRTWEHFSSHDYTAPRAGETAYPAVTQNGNAVSVHGSIFSAYQRYGAVAMRELIKGCLLRLTEPLVETDAPPTAEVSVMRQGTWSLIHIVNYHAARRATRHVEALETPVPLHDVKLAVTAGEAPARVYLARSGEVLGFQWEDRRVRLVVPRVGLHEIAVIEW